ncbi:hypothetical protein [Massilia sp. CFBP9026]|uniref:hypothetical protein n=1 Tax=Massilia sp. CFBP9026 TaxID=3096536 RepID=UPI002A6B4FEF|nr:hypothetical protein [Massilia sp. CFBP9026]MDY0961976.1 hypothetical protein [Massilia sp. CFBP9026]
MSIEFLLGSPFRSAVQDALSRFWVMLEQNDLWEMKLAKGERYLFQRTEDETGLLWLTDGTFAVSLRAAREAIDNVGDPWRLPTFDELERFAKHPRNPLRNGQAYRLKDNCHIFSDSERTDVDEGYWHRGQDGAGVFYAVTDWNASHVSVLDFMLKNVVSIKQANKPSTPDIWGPVIVAVASKALCAEIDWRPVRLPKLDTLALTDRNKGLWELHGAAPDLLETLDVRPRDPALDIRDHHVAIDFGTSSTVVACEEDGSKKLLRIGVQDYLQAPLPAHYENPTVLEIVDLDAALSTWNDVAYRPPLNWDDVRSSHEALNSLRANESDPDVVSSILPKIKQWALREASDSRGRITDRKGREHELAPLGLRAPVRGAALEVGPGDDFDPVELYAWHLGMIINWRKRGIHLRYYMTFPVAYPRDVKDKILASFKRGLQRSLPATLVDSPRFAEFSVKECASEPAAYAACALGTLGIAPSVEGVAYAVFDFGGGTSDFDFGLYRLPDAEQEDEGYEAVLEHFGAAGDRFLGGENLLENMAYLVFRENLDQCRERQIAFSRPLDAEDFEGSELFLDRTQAAATNTLMLIGRLRAIWETGAYDNSSGIEKLTLLNRQGEKTSCEFTIPEEALLGYLRKRIGQGVLNFCTAMHHAFGDRAPRTIHVLLAGNASRSALVQAYFSLGDGGDDAGITAQLHEVTSSWMERLFGAGAPELIGHAPLAPHPDRPYAPTGKTGVALGLLDLSDGGVIKVINRSAPDAGGEAPFAHFVGRIQLQRFRPGLVQGAPYGRWGELGPQRDKVFHLRHTTSPSAHTGEMASDQPGLYSRRLDFDGDIAGHRVYARPLGPDAIEICTAESLEAAEAGRIGNQRVVEL